MERAILVLPMVIALSFCACDESVTGDNGGDNENDCDLPSTPIECLNNLEQSFNNRDQTLYELCLVGNFTFYFDPHDVGVQYDSGYIIPISWGYEADIRAISTMFRKAKTIDLDVDTSTIRNPEEDDNEFETTDVVVRLKVTIFNDDIIEAEGLTDFKFVKRQGPDSTEYWAISEWRDKTSPSNKDDEPPPHPPSVGYIKAYYY